MKKSFLLTALGGVLAAAPAFAANYDFYITGSTAFRPNVFSACSKIFDGGAPANAIGSINNPSAAQANILTGGNLNLKPETANTITGGVVLQPRALPGFSMSVDYYTIKVSNIIAVPTPCQLISACFDNLTPSSATSRVSPSART